MPPMTPAHAALRSRAWLAGDDEVAMAHRVALASAGVDVSGQPGSGQHGDAAGTRPIIGIANSASELNPSSR